jgi:hypothetical protein
MARITPPDSHGGQYDRDHRPALTARLYVRALRSDFLELTDVAPAGVAAATIGVSFRSLRLHRIVMNGRLRRLIKVVFLGAVSLTGLFGAMQMIPYGRAHSNPPVVAEPAWDTPRTRALAKRACFDCHSNETKWPWYAKIAPFSWVMQQHVEIGRSVLNFSEWTRPYVLAEQAGSEVIRREMPPRGYRMLHDHARLTEEEKIDLARGLHATMGLPWRE